MPVLVLALIENKTQVAVLRNFLETAGYEVCIVDSFAKAMAILNEHPFDLIISDVHLENGGSVFDFLKWLKSHEEFRAIPFVLLSLQPGRMAKYLADGVSTAARHLGATKYISMEKFDANFLASELSSIFNASGQKSATL